MKQFWLRMGFFALIFSCCVTSTSLAPHYSLCSWLREWGKLSWHAQISVSLSSALNCMHAQSLSRIQLFGTPWTVACQVPLSMGFSRARILEWVAVSFSRGSSRLRVWTHVSRVSCFGRQILYCWATWEALVCLLILGHFSSTNIN